MEKFGERTAVLLLQINNLIPHCFNSDEHITTILGDNFSEKIPKLSISPSTSQLMGTPPKDLLWEVCTCTLYIIDELLTYLLLKHFHI